MEDIERGLKDLISVSQHFGKKTDYVIAGGGNTSFKNEDRLWIKASGTSLVTIDKKGFICMSRSRLKEIADKKYSDDPFRREQEVKEDLTGAIVSPSPANLRPSVETSLHDVIDFAFVVHTHPTLVNALMCSKNARKETERLFGKEALYIEYTDPGYILFKKVRDEYQKFISEHGSSPGIIFLQNHGVFVGADSTGEIREIYEGIESTLKSALPGYSSEAEWLNATPQENRSEISALISDSLKKEKLLVKGYDNELIRYFTRNSESFQLVEKPFTPDNIVYCKSGYLFLEKDLTESQISQQISEFKESHGYYPKIMLVEGGGLIVCEASEKSLQTVLEVFVDMMMISYLSMGFGGTNFMTEEQIRFIDTWEVENYRRKVSKSS